MSLEYILVTIFVLALIIGFVCVFLNEIDD